MRSCSQLRPALLAAAVAAALLFPSSTAAQGAAAPGKGADKPPVPPNPPPTVVVKRIDCENARCRAGKELTVVLTASAQAWVEASRRELSEVAVVIGGVGFPHIRARALEDNTWTLRFVLDQDLDPDRWKLLLAGQPRITKFPIALALVEPPEATPVGTEPRLRFISNASPAEFEVRPAVRTNFIYVFLVLLAGTVFELGRRSNLLRDAGPEPATGLRKPFSLGRTQLAVWMIVIIGSYLFIWTILGTTNPLNQTALILLGLAVATGMTAGAVDTTSAANAAAAAAGAAPPQVTRGFFKDLLSESEGITIYRLQLVVWTLVLVWVFGYGVWHDLAMPTFDNTLLGLMGISNASFVGGKLLPGNA